MSNYKHLEDFDASATGENFLTSLHTSVHGANDFSQISRWLEQNTADPLKPKQPWSFHEHEYQIDLLNETCHEAFYQKCSQVGASELFVRMKLAMLGMSEALTVIYVLPTRTFAQRFAKGRVDPIILNSPALRSLLNKDVDSNEMKQFGNCFLYISGSYGQSSAISVPAQALFWDEVDFCNQQNLTTFRSRMGHAKEDDLWFIRGFSTPTVFDYGINAYFKKGSQAFYGVWCRKCKDYVQVDFFRDLKVPGFEQSLLEWDKEHLNDPTVHPDKCKFHCQHCTSELLWQDFLDPTRRKWIHTFADRRIKSYQISPFDVPAINPPWRTLQQVEDYEVKSDWVNFKVGVPFEDASSSFMVEKANMSDGPELMPPLTHRELHQYMEEYELYDSTEKFLEWMFKQPQIANSCVMGTDVGKTSWFTIMHIGDSDQRKVIHAERAQSSAGSLLHRFVYLFWTYGCITGVIDAGPDFTLSQAVTRALPGVTWAAYYAQQKDNQMARLDLKEEQRVVSVLRTRSFDLLVSAFNGGRLPTVKLQEEEAFRQHLKAVKRVVDIVDENEKGTKERAKWIHTGDDHFCHSLNYANVAADLIYSIDGYEAVARRGSGEPGILPDIGKFRMRG
mgnify:CR=1 FL=1